MYRSARLSVLTLSAIVVARPAFADDVAEATELFKQGRELTRAGNHKDACPLFERSLKLVPALGTELNLARCYAATGKLVEAKKLFDELATKTSDAGQKERAALVREGLDDLASRMPHLKIDRAALRTDARVEVDGGVVDAGEPVPVDPGRHAITAAGAKPVSVDVAEGETLSVALEPTAPPAKPDDRPLILGLGAGGATMLVAGAIAGIAVLRERDAGRDRCAADSTGALVCDRRGADLLDHARNLSHFATVMLVAGVGLSTAATVLEIRRRRTTTAGLWGSSSSFGVSLGGAW